MHSHPTAAVAQSVRALAVGWAFESQPQKTQVGKTVVTDPLGDDHIKRLTHVKYSRQKFSEGGSAIRQGVWGPLKAPRSPWVFGAKSCNLAISRHFIQTFGKPCFPLLIFKDFHQILHQFGL